MRGAIPPLPQDPSWRGAQLNYKDNSTFTFLWNGSKKLKLHSRGS